MATTPKFTGLSDAKVNEALQLPAVRRALAARAARVLPTARALAYKAGAVEFAKALQASEGTRPGTGAKGGLQRTYARIGAPITEELRKADRGASLSRRQILRRASNG